ncbi:glutamate formimidoyltransferase [Rikenella microfusus]|uniref:glutamate formimidoyltransferase n=1 Tax=Rikenella microfusus TaxID=28139 RepID=UPI00248E4B67|nr:glutamate formimidoyltransferase [Rikenella microfusus]
MEKIIECVPNFSEGRDKRVIEAIVHAAASMPGAYVLHTDSGEAANRTVVTFAGEPEAVAEAAFRAVKTAAERIDMRRQTGEHPRIGATDVLPLVPVRGVSLAECAGLARRLAERVGGELGIPVYCYEAAASAPYRKGLESCRRGEYEGLRAKLEDPAWRPDFGPAVWHESVARTGASVIGARNFLGAVNFNLAPTDDRAGDLAVAKAIAKEIRAASGSDWSLPGVKAIGWWIGEYGFAQVSTNLTDMRATGLAQAYGAVSAAARRYGRSVTGTEVIGLLPQWALDDAGRCFGDSGDGATAAAIRGLGLDTMRSQGRVFDPDEKIVERVLAAKVTRKVPR